MAGRLLLTILAGLFYVLAWLPARMVRLLWAGTLWAVAAAKLGAQDGWKRADTGRP